MFAVAFLVLLAAVLLVGREAGRRAAATQTAVARSEAEAARAAAETKAKIDFQQCRSGNLRSAWERRDEVLGHRAGGAAGTAADLATELLALRDCPATIRAGGRPVLLPRREERRYLVTVLVRRRLPIVRGGRVVGSEPLPHR